MRHVAGRGYPHSPDGSFDIEEVDQPPFTSLDSLGWNYNVQLYEKSLRFSEESPVSSDKLPG